MKIVIAPDSFKGCLPAWEVAAALAGGIRRADPAAEIIEVPLADGGEGSLAVFQRALGGKLLTVPAHDALMRPKEAQFAICGATAVVELAQTCGIGSIEQLSPLAATTYGFGEVLRAAIASGAERVIACIGGSASTDGGAGLAQALGVRFYERSGAELAPGIGGGDLARIARAVVPQKPPCQIIIASDVTAPLFGESGAAVVFSPQKGAASEEVVLLDAALRGYARAVDDNGESAGDGAAGGSGFALRKFFDARAVSGAELMIEATALKEKMRGAAALITGEGRSDASTLQGKLCAEVAAIAGELKIPVILASGAVAEQEKLAQLFTEIHAVSPADMPLAEAISRAAELLESFAFKWALSRLDCKPCRND